MLRPAGDTETLRRVYGSFPTGVIALAALRGGQPVGLAASSFTAVSLAPPLVSVSIQLTSTTWPLLADRPRLGLSVLSATQHRACRQLAAKDGDRFAGLDWFTGQDGAVLLHSATAWMTCTIDTTVPAGDHVLVVLRVHELGSRPDSPLVFHGSVFHRLQPVES
ncbi:flavin reductase family protein [Pseudonocardia sp. CA-107938]|uniref:flavin reductase family protein n=1 Tax=Pseudonocardia sp. CA-107938 TaxID=3240021 RepID=UPI003D8CA6BC